MHISKNIINNKITKKKKIRLNCVVMEILEVNLFKINCIYLFIVIYADELKISKSKINIFVLINYSP